RGDEDQQAAARVALRPVQREQPSLRRLLRLVPHHTAGFDVSCDGTGARRSISAATAPARSAATAYVTKAAWIPNSDHARPPATGPSVTPTFSNSPKSPMTRAWRRRGDASEIQAVAAGQISDPPSARAAAGLLDAHVGVGPCGPAVGFRVSTEHERQQQGGYQRQG